MSDAPLEVEMPPRIAALPTDSVGRPVPWFVEWIDGKPDFRMMDARRLVEAVKRELCWICGKPLLGVGTFVLGPMCAVNRVSAEPPSHKKCGEYAAKACPFLVNPEKGRRAANMPEDAEPAPGVMIKRNPGVTLCWTARYSIQRLPGGLLFRVGEPYLGVSWWREGRPATRAEVEASIVSGVSILEESAAAQGPDALTRLAEELVAAQKYLPKE